MAKKTKISFTGDNSQNQGVNYQPTNGNYFQQYQQALANAPASSTTPQKVTTGQEQSNAITAGPVGNALKAQVSQQLQNKLAGADTPVGQYGQTNTQNVADPANYKYQGQYGNTWSPKVYNQDSINSYNQGLQQAQNWDSKSSLTPGFKERVYKIINGDQPQAQLSQYVPNAAQQRQTSDLGDGSTMMNPSNPVQAQEWNVDKLRQLHPDWDENTLQNYMSQNYNWQAYNALVNQGVIQPTQQSQAWTDYQNQQAQMQAQAQAQQYQEAPQQDYSDSGYGGDYGYGSSDGSGGGYTEEAPADTSYDSGDGSGGYTISAPSGDEYVDNSVGNIMQQKAEYWKNILGL